MDRSLEVRSKRRETSEMECDQPSTSSGITHGFPEEHILLEITDNQVRPWTVTREKENDDIKLELKDDVHSIPKYTVVLNSAMEFTVHVFHWPIPENHSVYTERKRRLNSVEDCQRLLHLIESSNICEGLPQDERTIENAEDPTSQVDWSGFQCQQLFGILFQKLCQKVISSQVWHSDPLTVRLFYLMSMKPWPTIPVHHVLRPCRY